MPTGESVTVNRNELREILREAAAMPSDTTHVILSKSEIESLASEIVKQTFTKLGVDMKNPLEMQQDFAYLRNLRMGVTRLTKAVQVSVVGIIITAVCTMLWIGFKAVLVAHGK